MQKINIKKLSNLSKELKKIAHSIRETDSLNKVKIDSQKVLDFITFFVPKGGK